MRYEMKRTNHGMQLWDNKRKCWAMWYGIGAIGFSRGLPELIAKLLSRRFFVGVRPDGPQFSIDTYDGRGQWEATIGPFATMKEAQRYARGIRKRKSD